MTLDIEGVTGNQPTVPRVDVELQHEIEQFLYHEAQLLDDREYQDWLDLFADDVHYWMPIRSTRVAADEDHEFTREWENSYFDDDKDAWVNTFYFERQDLNDIIAFALEAKRRLDRLTGEPDPD